MRRVLFLDVDGVLNRWDFNIDQFTEAFIAVRNEKRPLSSMVVFLDPILVSRVNMIVQHSACDVVLSSHWRDLAQHKPSRWNDACASLGFGFKVVDFVRQSMQLSRGEGIYQWIVENVPSYPVSLHDRLAVVALDDDRSIKMLEDEQYVLCDPNKGLTLEKAIEVYRKLKAPGLAAFQSELR